MYYLCRYPYISQKSELTGHLVELADSCISSTRCFVCIGTLVTINEGALEPLENPTATVAVYRRTSEPSQQ